VCCEAAAVSALLLQALLAGSVGLLPHSTNTTEEGLRI